MATRFADQIAGATNLVAVQNLGDRVPEVTLRNRTSYLHAKYTFDGTEAAADVINLGKLRAGDMVIAAGIAISSDGIATTATLDVGDDIPTADPDKYVDGADVASAGLDFGSAAPGVAATTAVALTQDAYITATLATLVTPVAGKKLELFIPYIGA